MGQQTRFLVLMALAISEGSDKPAHLHSLARAFASCIHKARKKKKAQTRKISSPAGYVSMGV